MPPKKTATPAKKGPVKDAKKDLDELKLVVFGAGGVGKSALIVQLIQNIFVEQYDPTLEDSYRKETKINDKQVTLDILDTAGQEEFHTLRDQYIRQGEGYIIVYSITNRSSFAEVDQFIEQILQSKEVEEDGSEGAKDIPIVVVGNKSDLEEQRKVTKSEATKLSEKYGVAFFEASAKTKTNVEQIFINCAEQVIAKVKSKKKKKGCRVQ